MHLQRLDGAAMRPSELAAIRSQKIVPAANVLRRSSAFEPAERGIRSRIDCRGTGSADNIRFAAWATRATRLSLADGDEHLQASADVSASLLGGGIFKPSPKVGKGA
jgi:hypothetical protein